MGVVCAQIGAREHYALPRALHRRRLLDTLYTDLWARPGGRSHPELPTGRVVSFPATALATLAISRLVPRGDVAGVYRRYLRVGRGFGRRVARHLARSGRRPDAFFAYTTGALEPVQLMRGWGVPAVVGQVDPARTEEDIVRQETEKWPGWAPLPGRIPDEYYDRLVAEWTTADRVLVNSEWSRDALITQGVPADKLVVLPLAYDPPAASEQVPRPAGRPTVLWLGQVTLRKGIQYLLAAARRLPGVRVVVAGPVGISRRAVATAPANVEFVGPVPRRGVTAVYRSAHMFVLPTLSDGFALAQLEAMAHGLPAVVTPNCGRVVTDGHDGRVVPAGDADALAAALDDLASDPTGTRSMGRRAAETAGRYSLAAYADQLARFVATLPPPAG